jgi:nucleotide-binding universal stress UspA family protein
MHVMVVVDEGTWATAVDVAKYWAPAEAAVTLVHSVRDDVEGVMRGSASGLLGRRTPDFTAASSAYQRATDDLLAAALARLGRPAETRVLHGRPERALTAAAGDADLLVLCRDGDRSHPGPHSLGPITRFVTDHATCPVLLVWPS